MLILMPGGNETFPQIQKWNKPQCQAIYDQLPFARTSKTAAKAVDHTSNMFTQMDMVGGIPFLGELSKKLNAHPGIKAVQKLKKGMNSKASLNQKRLYSELKQSTSKALPRLQVDKWFKSGAGIMGVAAQAVDVLFMGNAARTQNRLYKNGCKPTITYPTDRKFNIVT
jgi:hypothetical protein